MRVYDETVEQYASRQGRPRGLQPLGVLWVRRGRRRPEDAVTFLLIDTKTELPDDWQGNVSVSRITYTPEQHCRGCEFPSHAVVSDAETRSPSDVVENYRPANRREVTFRVWDALVEAHRKLREVS